jgi:hypothetical protein
MGQVMIADSGIDGLKVGPNAFMLPRAFQHEPTFIEAMARLTGRSIGGFQQRSGQTIRRRVTYDFGPQLFLADRR